MDKDDKNGNANIENVKIQVGWSLTQARKKMEFCLECDDKRITNKTVDIFDEIFEVFRMVMFKSNELLVPKKHDRIFFS